MKHWLPICALLLWSGFAPGAFAQAEGRETLRQTQNAFVAVARSVSPSVVSVRVEQGGGDAAADPDSPFGDGLPFGEDFFKRFFGDAWPGAEGGSQRMPRGHRPVVGQGSGFVFGADRPAGSKTSFILTNRHVVEDATKIMVRLQDGREFEAEVIGVDPQSDVAVLGIDAAGLPALPLGDSSRLEVGDWALAIGNPFGLRHTLTVGVVSAKGRTSLGISDYEDFIQTDAAINPGNSGGPLVNLEGEVVGMNTAIFSQSGGYMGIGFAIPIDLARHVANQLIEGGEVVRGYLGVVIQALTPALADSFGLDRARGILVAQVAEGSPAARSGLAPGDVVVSYRGRSVDQIGTFRNRVAQTEPGSRVELGILRDGDEKTLEVRIGRLDSEQQALAAGAQPPTATSLGLSVQALTPNLAQQLGLERTEGVVVTEVAPDSAAARAGIDVGSVVLEVDRQAVQGPRDFERKLTQSRKDGGVLLLVRDGEMQRYVVVDLG
jgi:serine protease Do